MTNNELVTQEVKWEGIFCLEVPSMWTVHEDDGVISLFDEGRGVGVMQISFARREPPQEPRMQETLELATDYALQRGWKLSPDLIRSISISNSPAIEFSVHEETEGEEDFWRVWHIMGRERIAFITYNCLSADKKKESIICDLIVESFLWL